MNAIVSNRIYNYTKSPMSFPTLRYQDSDFKADSEAQKQELPTIPGMVETVFRNNWKVLVEFCKDFQGLHKIDRNTVVVILDRGNLYR